MKVLRFFKFKNFSKVRICLDVILKSSDFLLPHLCLFCEERADWKSWPALCSGCAQIKWSSARCSRCGWACHESEMNEDVCHRCINIYFPYQTMQSIGPYKDWWRQAILLCKYGDDPLASGFIKNELLSLNHKGYVENAIITYIPSHPKRIRERGRRGQHIPPLLAKLIQAWQLPLIETLKKQDSPPQTGLSRKARRENIEGSLIYHGPKPVPAIVHLFDDVFTTGSTIREASRVLKAAGVKKIFIYTFAFTQMEKS